MNNLDIVLKLEVLTEIKKTHTFSRNFSNLSGEVSNS